MQNLGGGGGGGRWGGPKAGGGINLPSLEVTVSFLDKEALKIVLTHFFTEKD